MPDFTSSQLLEFNLNTRNTPGYQVDSLSDYDSNSSLHSESPLNSDGSVDDAPTVYGKERVSPADEESDQEKHQDWHTTRSSSSATRGHMATAQQSTLSNKAVRGLPSSCVFVASLAAVLSDDQLCLSVTEKFKEFGELSGVKVLRDQENRPYAFVQFTNDLDARRALNLAHGSLLNGRPIRCEPARVNRTLFITHATPISYIDVNQFCSLFGKLEQLVPSRDKFQFSKGYNMLVTTSSSWFVRFVFRDDAIRAFANFKTEDDWSVQWAQNIIVPKKFNLLSRINGETEAVAVGDFIRGKSKDLPYGRVADDGLIEDVEGKITIDKKSIFVGQLHQDANNDNLREHFEVHGKILNVNVIHKPTNVFAFIEYETEMAAAAALEKENHAIFLNKTIHVQYKEIGGFYRRRYLERRTANYQQRTFNRNTTEGDADCLDVPRLNLAPPPISIYRKRQQRSPGNDTGISNNSSFKISGNRENPNMVPIFRYMPPNMNVPSPVLGAGPRHGPEPALAGFNSNTYAYLPNNILPYTTVDSMPDSYWINSQGGQYYRQLNSGYGQDNEIDTTLEMNSDASDLLDRRYIHQNDASNSATTYNHSSAGSVNQYDGEDGNTDNAEDNDNKTTTDVENAKDGVRDHTKSGGYYKLGPSNGTTNPYYLRPYYYPQNSYTLNVGQYPIGNPNVVTCGSAGLGSTGVNPMGPHPYMMVYPMIPRGLVPNDKVAVPPSSEPVPRECSPTNQMKPTTGKTDVLKGEHEYLDY